jgi:hypothetical protein
MDSVQSRAADHFYEDKKPAICHAFAFTGTILSQQ